MPPFFAMSILPRLRHHSFDAMNTENINHRRSHHFADIRLFAALPPDMPCCLRIIIFFFCCYVITLIVTYYNAPDVCCPPRVFADAEARCAASAATAPRYAIAI